MSKLNEMIREFREDIGQSIEGLALLMQLEPDEFARLEEDWIPPDDILKRLCALFEWNYNDIKRLADKTPSVKSKKKELEKPDSSLAEETSAKTEVPQFAKMIQEARITAGQNTLGIATLLSIAPDYYEEFESGLIPPDDLLRKLCSLYGWNYKQIQQKINSHSPILYGTRQPPLPVKEMQARLPKIELPEIPDIPEGVTLHELIQQSRIEAKQNVEGISLLLQIGTEYYEQIEAGEVFPEQELLKRICSLFGWNYHELLQREKSSQLSKLQPAVTSLDSSDSSITETKLREIQEEIAANWQQISREQQETILTHLELVSKMMEPWKNED